MIDYTGNGGWKIEVNPTVFLIILAVAFAGIIYTTVSAFIRFQKNIDNYSDNTHPSKPPKTKSVKATVISRRQDGHYEGSHKFPQYTNDYYITFVTKKNKTIELKVEKAFFDEINIGTTSTLITQNGEFFDFTDGEITE